MSVVKFPFMIFNDFATSTMTSSDNDHENQSRGQNRHSSSSMGTAVGGITHHLGGVGCDDGFDDVGSRAEVEKF